MNLLIVHFRSMEKMIKKIISLIIALGYSHAATELPEGMHPFCIPKTVLARVTKELSSFSCNGEFKVQHEQYEQFKSKYTAIELFLRDHKTDHTDEKIIKELLGFIHEARLAISDRDGNSLEWECLRYACGGHTFSKMYPSHSEAQSSKPEWYRNYKNTEGINPCSVRLYDIKQHGRKTNVASGVTITTVYGGAGCIGLAALGTAATTIATGGVAPVVFLTVWNAGWWTGVVNMAVDTKREYDSIQYEMLLGYEHEENALNTCDNKKTKTYKKSTYGLIKAMNSLFSSVERFYMEQQLEQRQRQTNQLTERLTVVERRQE